MKSAQRFAFSVSVLSGGSGQYDCLSGRWHCRKAEKTRFSVTHDKALMSEDPWQSRKQLGGKNVIIIRTVPKRVKYNTSSL